MNHQEFLDGIEKWQRSVEQRAAVVAAEFGGETPSASATAMMPGSATERVLTAIANGAATTKQLTTTLGLGESTVANVLTGLVRSGAVRRPRVGEYEAV